MTVEEDNGGIAVLFNLDFADGGPDLGEDLDLLGFTFTPDEAVEVAQALVEAAQIARS